MTETQNAGLREYELIYVLRPTVDNAEAERVNGKVGEIIETFGGRLTKLDNWGRRRLAYPIQNNNRGLFVYTKYLSQGGAVAEIERNLRITDSVIRQQTVLLNRSPDVAAEIDPEEVKFEPVEAAEPENEIGIEERLGLVARPPRQRPDDRDRDRAPAAPAEGAAAAPAEGAAAAPAEGAAAAPAEGAAAAPAEGAAAAPAEGAAAPAEAAAPAAAAEPAAAAAPAEAPAAEAKKTEDGGES